MDSLVKKNIGGEMKIIIQKDQWFSFISEYELSNAELYKSKVNLRIENSVIRKNVSFIRISNKNSSLFVKSSKQYSSEHLPLIINMCHISRIFLQNYNN